MSLEPEASTEDPLSQSKARSQESQPILPETSQPTEFHSERVHEQDDNDRFSVMAQDSATEGISDSPILTDEDEVDSTQVVIQDQTEITTTAKEEISTLTTSVLKQNTRKKTRQPRYRPPIRAGEVKRSTRQEQTADPQSAQSRSQSMSVHARPLTHRRNQWRVSLIAPRTSEFPEEITMESTAGSETWYARQDEWYEGITPSNLGFLLESGSRWESEDERFQWVLSAREIYVLAPDSTISGFVNTSTLALAQDHVVLCTNRQREAVRKALLDTGADASTIVMGNGIPDGWLLFDNIRPSVAIKHDTEAGIFNALRPVHALKISFEGGIRLSGSTWLYGHPPQIKIRGENADDIEVLIDGNPASLDSNRNYIAPDWDADVRHKVFCGGVTESYELSRGMQDWEIFEAYSYEQSLSRGHLVSICGPVVFSTDDDTRLSLIPASNNCLIGSVPGEIELISQSSEIRGSTLLAQASFPAVWNLPANPLRCDKANSSVRLMKALPLVSPERISHPADRCNVLRWCQTILNASRKGLRVYPDTDDAKSLWLEYKKKARQLRRQLR